MQPQGWEPIWASLDSLPEQWRTPEPSVLTWADALRKAGGRRVLDLGCGIGRHTVGMARLGLSVTATDFSPSGLKTCAAWLAREGLSATLACHEMSGLPLPSRTFDGLIAYNVVYHTTLAEMRQILAEIRRILQPGGRLYATLIAREDSRVVAYQVDVKAGRCHELESFTFVYPRFGDAPEDKFLPHHYCDEAEVRDLLADFYIDHLDLDRREHSDGEGELCVSVHYRVQAHRRM